MVGAKKENMTDNAYFWLKIDAGLFVRMLKMWADLCIHLVGAWKDGWAHGQG